MTPPEPYSLCWAPWPSAVCVILRLHLNWYRALWNVFRLEETRILKSQCPPSLLAQEWDLGDTWMCTLRKADGTWLKGSRRICRVVGINRTPEDKTKLIQRMRERLGLA